MFKRPTCLLLMFVCTTSYMHAAASSSSGCAESASTKANSLSITTFLQKCELDPNAIKYGTEILIDKDSFTSFVGRVEHLKEDARARMCRLFTQVTPAEMPLDKLFAQFAALRMANQLVVRNVGTAESSTKLLTQTKALGLLHPDQISSPPPLPPSFTKQYTKEERDKLLQDDPEYLTKAARIMQAQFAPNPEAKQKQRNSKICQWLLSEECKELMQWFKAFKNKQASEEVTSDEVTFLTIYNEIFDNYVQAIKQKFETMQTKLAQFKCAIESLQAQD